MDMWNVLNLLSPLIETAPKLSGHAYLDPGSGSFILQLLIAAFLGGAFMLRRFWSKVFGLFRKGSPQEELPSNETTDPSEPSDE
jgi:hypothetical protein